MPRPGESGSPYTTERNHAPGSHQSNRDRDGRHARSNNDRDGSDRRSDDRDRRRDDEHRSSRKEHSRERRRDDDRMSGRGNDRRRRSRDRDYRDDYRSSRSYRDSRDYRDRDNRDRRERRDDSRDRTRRRDDYDESPPRSERADRDTRDSRDGRTREPPRSTAPSKSTEEELKQAEEEKKKERLAKIEAWKRQVAEDKARKEMELSTGAQTPRSVDNKEDLTALSSPRTPLTPQSPVNYAGKFDPKAIAKKAAAKTAALKSLGGDVPMLDASLRNNADVPRLSSNKPAAAVSAKIVTGPIATGNVSGFGLAKSAPLEAEKGAKRGLELGEEESARKRIDRLPTPPPTDDVANDHATKDVVQDNDDDEDMVDAQDEEEEAAAARAAAEKREERMLAEAAQQQHGGNDVDMDDTANDQAENNDDEEEIDPLDAFMSDLGKTVTKAPGLGSKTTRKSQQQEPQAMFSDEDEMDTMENDTEDILDVVAKSKKKKDIPKVDHSKVNYEPFNKNFYTEPIDVAELTEEETKNLRFELDDIKVRGKNVPKPVQKWPQFGLGVQSLDVIQKLGYEKPSSIQAQAIPAIMSGRDVIGIAKTGSGKTVAFLLPMFRHIKDQKPLKSLDGPIGLIMTPTRELATQIHKECRPWLKALGLRAVCAYGGAPIKDQIAELKRGAEIVVCTPGRMIDLLAANSGRVTNLRRITYIVLDEADRMFDMGFEPQVMKVMANVRPDRQTVLFSATFPKNMEALARKVLHDPVEIVVGGRSVVAPEITQIVEVRPENSKFMRLLQLLGEVHEDEDARSLVFVDKQESAEELMNAILRKGYPCFTIHGGKDQYDRDSVISDFKAGVFPVLVATSVAARGLDVKQLKMVVNFDCPNHLEDYVHRAGRTGRAGQTGQAVTFITPEQGRYAIDIAKALTQSEQPIPEALQKLVDTTAEEIKAGKGKAAALGFGGKGLDRLDQDRDAARKRERGAFKTGDEEEDDDDKKKGKDKEEDRLPEIKAAGAAPAAATTTSLHEDLFNQPIEVVKRETPPPSGRPADRITRVNAAVEAINARLRKTGDIRSATAIDNRGPDAGAFHATLQINDFPQKARWAVTNRNNVAKILESTGTSITTKGTYYKPGTAPQPDSQDLPKLYVLVEGDTEVVVQTACRELMRLLREGTVAEANAMDRAPAGRYSVV